MATSNGLKQSLTGNGQTAERFHPGGSGAFGGSGTFDGGSLTLQVSFDSGTTWVPVTASAMTAANMYVFVLPPCLIRGDLASATTPSVTVFYEPVLDL